jgi:GDPmannose 4,6-dehydratase
MSTTNSKPGRAIVTGAGGQDGFFLTQRLLSEGWTVHAITRHLETFKDASTADDAELFVHDYDLREPQLLFELISKVQPDEFYNLAGQSSVSKSLSDPLYTWRTNAEAVVHLMECIRLKSPHTRFYQASSTDMFGIAPSGLTCYNEDSPLNPQSPYASAKAAAHLLCRSYREVYGLRIACGILSNHESYRRPGSFLSRKVVDHVLQVKELSNSELAKTQPLTMGNLKAKRDWGFAPEYVEGMCRIIRQLAVRAKIAENEIEPDVGANYRDYVLGTGRTHAVWQLVDAAFNLAGRKLRWNLEGDEPSDWYAKFEGTNQVAVAVNPKLLRMAEPLEIQVDPSRARNELGWSPKQGLEIFLKNMLDPPVARSRGSLLPVVESIGM